MQARSQVAVIILLMAAVSTCVRAASNAQLSEPISDDIRVVEFQELDYPMLARSSGSEGVVVVLVKLDHKGQVLEASALSGKDALVPDSLANVKKWRFQPNAAKTAVVVYSFRKARGTCKSESSFFILERPNLATITACWPPTKQGGSDGVAQQAVDVMVSDKDMEVLDFEDLKYPPMATLGGVRGVVVVQAKLNEHGEVTETIAVSGHKMLITACLENIRKWHFKPNTQRTVIVVYNFQFP
jgi:TonB family protein